MVSSEGRSPEGRTGRVSAIAFGTGLTRVGVGMDRCLEQRPKPLRLDQTADQSLDTLAAHCQRINDSGH